MQIAAVSVLLAIMGTAVTLVGVFQAGGRLQLPIAPDQVLTTGLSAGIFSYLGLFAAGLTWVFVSSSTAAEGG